MLGKYKRAIPEQMVTKKKKSAPSRRQIKAERRIYRGAPTVFVNDKPINVGAVLFRNAPTQPPGFRYALPSLRKADPKVIMIYANYKTIEVGPDPDFPVIERWFDQTFSQHPKALGVCHIGFQPSLKWTEAHPSEMTLYDRPVDWSKEKGKRLDSKLRQILKAAS